MFKRREEFNTYLTHVCRHHHKRLQLMKAPVLAERSILYFPFFIIIFSSGSLHYSDVYRGESGRCCTPPFFLTFYHFTFPGFLFILIISFYINDFWFKKSCSLNYSPSEHKIKLYLLKSSLCYVTSQYTHISCPTYILYTIYPYIHLYIFI